MRANLLAVPATLFALSCAVGCTDADSATLPLDTLSAWRLEPSLRIGSVEADSTEAFTWFRRLAVADNRRIYTVHPQEQRLRIWSAAGELIGTIEPGDGPGELGNPHEIGIRADTLWVMDGEGYVLQKYTLDGRFLSGERLGIGQAPEGGRGLRPAGLLADGSLYGSRPAWSTMVADGTISADTLFMLDRDLAILDTLVIRPMTVWTIRNPDPGQRGLQSFGQQPFGDADIVVLDPSAPAVYRVDRRAARTASVDSFRVTKRTLGGDTIYSRAYRYIPHPLEAASVEEVIDERTARFEDHPSPAAPTVAQADEWARATLVVPEFLPPVSDAIAGHDGTLWLARERPDSGATRWIVLSASGEPLGALDVPERVRAIHVTRDRVCGSLTDELDVPYVVCYRVVEPRSAPLAQ